jgi:hypothetical protein
MSDGSSPFDASPSALGYLHQCRCALLLALQRDETPELGLKIEKLDDVSVHEPNGDEAVVVELRQHKLHLNHQGNLGDKSPDIWKALRVWAEATVANLIDLDRVQLCLVTTSQANVKNSIGLLRPAPHLRNCEEARRNLEEAGATSANSVVAESYQSLLKLDEAQRQKLFGTVYLLDGGLDATEIRRAISRCIWSACIEKHRAAFLDRLEGWWINLVVFHLSEPNPNPIPIHLVQQQVHEIGASFRRESLPDNLIDAAVPESAINARDESNFVRQLNLLGISPARLHLALEDHYRAFTQRSKWAKEQLLGFDEEVNYEARLVTGWKERFLIMVEGIPNDSDDPTLAHHGSKLYEWVVTEAPSRSQLWFRTDFMSEYMTKGSYHMLADQLRVGWHPEYEGRLVPPPADQPSASKKPLKRRSRAKK